ncbi:hypothetical protein Q4E93_13605 [Flavitalea sp. BT771]|uniref:hypothetical protein n=1 Tax=Flavitalea sp. BT771 TaxID=3063329 RepID=UPI0026E155CC|nr:hypothetical protein [Flavitalea sp. BT771]MDO6431634.1 hypothetical protein [Flavitalea sp. BT771]MDV6220542.1 hypothetical protein [Flavitalea sp. BT771]
MLHHHTGSLVDDLIELGDSTTLFLEALRGNRLLVTILSQEEIFLSGHWVIKRVVKLFFDTPEIPVLYCVSYLNRDSLTEEEYKCLVDDTLPIGLVFLALNNAHSIQKKNITTIQEISPDHAAFLNVRSPKIFRKKYDYWVDDREIGCICEFFNEESLGRV